MPASSPMEQIPGAVQRDHTGGGASRRMGANKAELLLEGKSLLAWQVEKLQALGIRDILPSGKDCPKLPGARVIPGELPGRGPLGGLYPCSCSTENARCLVLSVDTPLVPCSVLTGLCRAHASGATLLRHAGRVEPLIGVYDASLAQTILPLIGKRGAPAKALIQSAAPSYFDYTGPEEFLHNCNTPQEFAEACRIAQDRLRCPERDQT